ncbi:hypothetical protein Barb6XT_01270 [Bacteroidales bacterium Barb6XT]|nr:hypothetical protein Barb6XT_01270 [Bacteroidales bacterium Barb6XT]
MIYRFNTDTYTFTPNRVSNPVRGVSRNSQLNPRLRSSDFPCLNGKQLIRPTG